MRPRGNTGFSLLELLLVVAIILIIATIAIPSFIRARQAANEASALASLRTLATAEAAYSVSNSGMFATVSGLMATGLMDSRYGGQVSGYTFVVATNGTDFTATANPVSLNSGRYGFYVIADNVIRYSTISTMAPAGQSGLSVASN
jgi:prepilin-type N-terminal cleavage/methylation domain-containing protein